MFEDPMVEFLLLKFLFDDILPVAIYTYDNYDNVWQMIFKGTIMSIQSTYKSKYTFMETFMSTG